ncbi:hypothetical protein RB195_006454 [Necator americanus]|uniref:Tensin n=1 Tax=Necator americanus TaxID=51031 RepID=A0ABR1BVG1_NECAM
MARLMCFRSSKKNHEEDDSYGDILKNSASNVAPNNRMVVRGPVEEGLTLHYVTQRIIVLCSPDEGTEKAYVASLKAAALTLKTKHFEHFKVWNVSRPRQDLSRCLAAENVGWPPRLAPPLDRLCALCKQFEQWLTINNSNVIVIHCKGNTSRAAIVLASFMHYNAICSNDEFIEDRYDMRRFADKHIGANGQPSHKRYITYFSSLLSGKIRVNPAPIYLHRITISHLIGRVLSFKVYERLQPVYQTSPSTSKDVLRFDVEHELRLRGDVLIKCHQVIGGERALLFCCQINTCALDVPAKGTILALHKEELDHIFADSSIDNRVVLELMISPEPPKSAASANTRRSLEDSRTNSYEDFVKPEDESNGAVVYSEIRRKPSKEAKDVKEKEDDSREVAEQRSETQATSTDQAEMPPPPVPPKPRSASAMGDPVIELPERRGVLPAQVRPLVNRPPSPREAGRATPSIEPDLVGKDRYDKASKCFSYAPTKALNEAFERPRKGSVTKVERREEEIQNIDPGEVSNAYIPHSEPARTPVPPKWDDEVENAKQAALLDELARIPARSQSVAGQPYYLRNDEAEERPMVVEQAQRATPTPTSTVAGGYRRKKRETKYGSYRTLNDDAYNSDMDDLCDPDFYLNYTPSSTPATKTAPKPPERAPLASENRIHAGTRSVQLPRKKYQPVEAFTDPLDDILASTAPVVATSCVDLRDRDSHRSRNCRSIAALTGPNSDRRLFAEDYDAVSEARDADDWLTHKLRKVKSKRDIDPDQMRRRNQERMLLEELKNAHGEAEARGGRNEAEYTVEGVGTRDPLAEYRREEERLKNTQSPFDEMPRRGRIRSKPPTPPPRERSRSPARSERATPSIDSYNYRNHNGVNEATAHDFSNLGSIVHGNASYSSKSEQNLPNGHLPSSATIRRDSRGTSHFEPRTDSRATLQRRQSYGTDRPPFQYADTTIQRSNEPIKFYSGQERVAAAIYRAETPQRELYASGTIHRAETPNRYYPDNSTISHRSETPAFPILRETPLPFHPLLYAQNGNSRQDLDTTNTMNYRSASPRSQYAGQLSRRSSLMSVDTSEIIHHHPVFVKDTSKYWYKPTISREQAINMLRDKAPGTFVVRDSNSFPGAFGLALKVATPPPGVAPGDGTELVRHFLIEPSPKGVKLKGCNNEPVFGSLSALVYQHSITPLALPTKLLLPEFDPATTPEHVSATQALLEQGAACNVAYIGSVDCESLTGSECVRRAVARTVEDTQRGLSRPVSVHFKVSSQGVTLTDNTRKVFFRRHFPVNSVIFAGMDPADRKFDNFCVIGFHDGCVKSARLFAIVARKPSSMENACHVFAELEPEQPATAVVNFINKVLFANRRS